MDPFVFPSVGNPLRVKAHRALIQQVGAALADRQSKDALRSVLAAPPLGHAERFTATMLRAQQYFEYVDIQPGDTVFNFGVFDGFELPTIAALMHGQGRIVNIDPLGGDYLARYVTDALKQFDGLVEFMRYCVTDTDGETGFMEYEDGQAASHAHSMSDKGKARYPGELKTYRTRTLASVIDEAAPERIDLMKFDIEGGEEMALKDLPDIVRTFRPQIAMSVYHAVQHLWEMPLALIEMCPDYRFYFGNYSTCRYESIFYCVPEEKVRRLQ